MFSSFSVFFFPKKQILLSALLKVMQMKVFKLSLQSHILSLAHYKAETKLLVIFFFQFLLNGATQLK